MKPKVREILPTESDWEFRQKPPPEALCVVLKQNQRSQLYGSSLRVRKGDSYSVIRICPFLSERESDKPR